MRNLHELILNRRSIRKYSEEQISPESVKLILETALVAPSSKGKMPCQFVVVEAISDCWVEDASIAAILMQLQAEDCGLGSCWVQIANRLREDGSSAEEYIRNLLSIPEGMRVLCVMTFGKKAEERKPYDPEKCKWEKIHIGKWRTEE